MSILDHPALASALARSLRTSGRLGARRTARASTTRLPEYRTRPRDLTIPTALGPVRAGLYRPLAATRGVGDQDGGPPPVHLNLQGGEPGMTAAADVQ